MKCYTCDEEMICRTGEYQYSESGLDNVILSGVDIWECSCGESAVSIPAIAELHNLIGRALIEKEERLSGPEIRFLRSNMHMKAVELADIIGVSKSAFSRWESGKKTIGVASDRALRLIYGVNTGLPKAVMKRLVLKHFKEIKAKPLPAKVLRLPLGDWSKDKGPCSVTI